MYTGEKRLKSVCKKIEMLILDIILVELSVCLFGQFQYIQVCVYEERKICLPANKEHFQDLLNILARFSQSYDPSYLNFNRVYAQETYAFCKTGHIASGSGHCMFCYI